MSESDFTDLSSIVCPDTGVSAREAAINALIARDHLGGEAIAVTVPSLRDRRLAMIQDVRVLTGVLALELDVQEPAHGRYDAAARARLVHEATLRTDDFAFCAALTLEELSAVTDPDPGDETATGDDDR